MVARTEGCSGYFLLCCLLKFQTLIGDNEVDVYTDHFSIVQWYKQDLCTLSGPLGSRRRWHEFSSQLNLLIRYYPDDKNVLADTMSTWASPAGVAQDTNFHGSNEDLHGWNGAEQQECQERQKILE